MNTHAREFYIEESKVAVKYLPKQKISVLLKNLIFIGFSERYQRYGKGITK